MIKIAILSPFRKEGEIILKKNNFKIVYEKDLKKLVNSNIKGVILDIRKFGKEEFDKFKNLKIISRFGVGTNNIDLEVLKKKNKFKHYQKFNRMVCGRTCFKFNNV